MNTNCQNLFYDSNKQIWDDARMKNATVDKFPKKVLSPEEEISNLKRKLGLAKKALQLSQKDFTLLYNDHEETKIILKNCQGYKNAYDESQAHVKELNRVLKEKQEELNEIINKIDEAIQKSMIAEIDVADLRDQMLKKDAMFKQLRGRFIWRHQHPEKKDANIINPDEITDIIMNIENGLNLKKIHQH